MPKIKAIPDGMLMMQNLMQRDTPVLMDNVEHSICLLYTSPSPRD